MRKRWTLRNPLLPPVTIQKELGVNPIVARILSTRATNLEDASFLLRGGIESLSSPFELSGMESAVKRIVSAIEKKEAILIHGDYDVDGVTALALLERNLKRLEAKDVLPYIPDRFIEGYGLSRKGIEFAKEREVNLIITVDCGITAKEEIELANRYGIDVIITDHHEPKEELPNALAIVNPKLSNRERFTDLSGCGVVFKLLQGIYEYTGGSSRLLLWDLDLVAIGTIADIVPLEGENRILVKYGLKILEKTKKMGLLALKKISKIETNIAPWHISFALAPRINAAGRLTSAEDSFKLLTTQNREEALYLAKRLDEENSNRQVIERNILDEAIEMVKKIDLKNYWVIVLAKESWHEGVIGIVASRLVDLYHRPSVLISLPEKEELRSLDKEEGRGSCRSIPGFNIHKALMEIEEFLVDYGGHRFAAGIKIRASSIDNFRDALNRIAHRELTEEDLIPEIAIDAEIKLKDITDVFYEEYKTLEPFGAGNPIPVFLLKDVEVVGEPQLIKDKHIKFTIRDGSSHLQVVLFNEGELITKLMPGNTRMDIVCNLEEDTFTKRSLYKLKLLDLGIKG